MNNLVENILNGEDLENNLIKLYENHGYTLVKGEKYLLMYFSECTENKLPDMLIKIQNIYGTMDIVLEDLMTFEENPFNCYQYKTIYLKGYDKECDVLKDFNLSIENSDFIKELGRELAPNEKFVELYEHNKSTYDELINLLRFENRAAVIQSTGTGKTIIIDKLVSSGKYRNILCLAPSTTILNQIKESVGERVLSNINFLDMTYYKMNLSKDVQESTYDLIILDELHRVGAIEWNKSISNLIKNNVNSKIVGLTATPIRNLDGNRNMVEEICNGVHTKELYLSSAIARKILPAPIYISSLETLKIERSRLFEKIENSFCSNEKKQNLIKEVNDICNQWITDDDVPKLIETYLNNADKQKTIVFCKNINHLYDMIPVVVGWFKKAGYEDIDIHTLHSKQGNADKVIKNFKSSTKELSLLFTVNMINEGLHLDGGIVTSVIFLRDTKSQIVAYQQLGRVLQSNQKTTPVVFDLVNNFDLIKSNEMVLSIRKEESSINRQRLSLNLPAFKTSFRVINNTEGIIDFFRKIETQLTDYWQYGIDILERFYKENGHINLPYRSDDIEIQRGYNFIQNQKSYYKRNELSEEKVEKLESLGIIWDELEAKWMENYNAFVYKKTHNMSTKDISSWIYTCRELYERGELSKERENLLIEAGFNFKSKPQTKMPWIDYIELIKKYLAAGGKLSTTTEFEGVNIGIWYYNQLKLKEEGSLSEERVEILDSLGIKLRKASKLTWDEKIEIVKNHLSGKKDSRYKTISANLRNSYEKGRIPDEVVTQLSDIGYVLEKKTLIPFETMASKIIESLNENKEITYREKTWLKYNNKKLSEKLLTEEESSQIRLINNLITKIKDENKKELTTKEILELTKECFDATGKITFKTKYKNIELGKLLSRLKDAVINGYLPEDEKDFCKEIESLGINLSKKNKIKDSDEITKDLEAYARGEKKLTPGAKSRLSNIRRKYRDGVLSEEEIRYYTSLGINLNPTVKIQSWDERYSDVCIAIESGKAKTESQHSWIKRQRKLYREGLLEEEKTKKLLAVGII